MTDLDAAVPRPAATVVVMRRGIDGPEILLVRRTRQASFMADAYVFPGGRVEAEDGSTAADEESQWQTFARAAVRELGEEANIFLPASALVPLAHWITPSVEPKRFDARFFLALLLEDQTARHDDNETVDTCWATAKHFLTSHERGMLKLPPPTLCNLEDLAEFVDVDDALKWALQRDVVAILPKLVTCAMEPTLAEKEILIVLPWDAEYGRYPGEGVPLSADLSIAGGHSRLLLRAGRWWRERKVSSSP